jgi:hypothetical protein
MTQQELLSLFLPLIQQQQQHLDRHHRCLIVIVMHRLDIRQLRSAIAELPDQTAADISVRIPEFIDDEVIYPIPQSVPSASTPVVIDLGMQYNHVLDR